MSVAASREEFELAAKGLPEAGSVDLSDEVVLVEPVTAEYFRDDSVQRCVVRRNGRLLLSRYD